MRKITILVPVIGLILLVTSGEGYSAGPEEHFELLESTVPSRRRTAVSGLSEYDGTEIVERLGRVLTRDPHFSVRARAAEVLGNLRDRDALPYLIEALQDENRNVKAAAIVSFGYIRDRSAVEHLIDFVRKEEDRGLKVSAINVLGVLGAGEAVPLLTEALENEEPRIRRVAAQSLGRIRSSESTGALIERLNDENKDVRLFSVRALGEVGEADALSPLKSLLNLEPDREVKIAAAHALGQLGDNRGLPVALQAATSNDTDIQRTGLRALGAIGQVNEQVKAAVRAAYNSDNPRVERDAATAASFLGIDLP